jgi:hypothetical protein
MRLRESERTAQGRPLTRAPGRVVQLLDGQIRTERASAVAPDQRNDREPPFFAANEESFIHGVILALDSFRCPRTRKETLWAADPPVGRSQQGCDDSVAPMTATKRRSPIITRPMR